MNIGTEPVVGFGLIGTKYIMSLWEKVSNKTNWVGLIVIKTIVGLGLTGNKC